MNKIDQKFKDTLETIAEAYGFYAYVCAYTGRFFVTNDNFYWDTMSRENRQIFSPSDETTLIFQKTSVDFNKINDK